MSEGRKDDGGKLRYDLLPPELLEEVSKVLTFGAEKYEDRNWEQGINYSRVYAALQRHLWSWWDCSQPDTDPETGYNHLSHAACCLAFLLTYEQRGMEEFNDKPYELLFKGA